MRSPNRRVRKRPRRTERWVLQLAQLFAVQAVDSRLRDNVIQAGDKQLSTHDGIIASCRIHIQDRVRASADVVPEARTSLRDSIVGGKLFVTGLNDVVTQTRIYSLDGKQLGELQYPTLGSASGVYGLDDSENAFYTFRIVHHSTGDLSLRFEDREDRKFFAKRQVAVRVGAVRGQAGLLHVQGRHARAYV